MKRIAVAAVILWVAVIMVVLGLIGCGQADVPVELAPSVVWVRPGEVVDVARPTVLNIVGVSAAECDWHGGKFVAPDVCEGVDY